MTEVRVRNEELRSMREAMRELNQLVDALERREIDKLVLTQRNRMRAVVLSVEHYADLQALVEASHAGLVRPDVGDPDRRAA